MSWRVVELPEQPLLTCAARAGQRLIVSLVASERRSRACGDICRSIPYGASVRPARWRSERGWKLSLSQRTSQAGELERKPSSLSRGTEGSNPPPPSGESVSRGISLFRIEKSAVAAACAGPARRHGRQRRAELVNITSTAGNISVGPYRNAG